MERLWRSWIHLRIFVIGAPGRGLLPSLFALLSGNRPVGEGTWDPANLECQSADHRSLPRARPLGPFDLLTRQPCSPSTQSLSAAPGEAVEPQLLHCLGTESMYTVCESSQRLESRFSRPPTGLAASFAGQEWQTGPSWVAAREATCSLQPADCHRLLSVDAPCGELSLQSRATSNQQPAAGAQAREGLPLALCWNRHLRG